MAASFEAGWRERAGEDSGPSSKRRPMPSAAAVFWGPRAGHMQTIAGESFVGGVDIDDVISKDGEFEESYIHDTLGFALSPSDSCNFALAGGRGRVVLDEQGEPVAWPWTAARPHVRRDAQ